MVSSSPILMESPLLSLTMLHILPSLSPAPPVVIPAPPSCVAPPSHYILPLSVFSPRAPSQNGPTPTPSPSVTLVTPAAEWSILLWRCRVEIRPSGVAPPSWTFRSHGFPQINRLPLFLNFSLEGISFSSTCFLNLLFVSFLLFVFLREVSVNMRDVTIKWTRPPFSQTREGLLFKKILN